MSGQEEVEIVTAGEHFLYLPLYYAATRDVDFFGYIPKKYSIKVDGGDLTAGNRRTRTDRKALELLLDTDYSGHKKKLFAVCDPAVLAAFPLPVTGGEEPAIIASLISNTAFWAVDHQQRPVPTLADLAEFDQILAWSEGTTCHRIAAHISSFAKPRRRPRIQTVAMGRELDSLRESTKGTLAISPDIMLIQDLVEKNDNFKVLYALGKSPEYSNVLVTALITLRSVVEERPDLVHGLLRALQRAVVLTRILDDRVLDFAAQRFQQDGPEAVKRALMRANDSHVFPRSVEVDQARWVNACRLSFAAKKQTLTSTREARSVELFDRFIAPYVGLAASVYQETIIEPAGNPGSPPLGRKHHLRRNLAIAALCVALAIALIATPELLRWRLAAVSVCLVVAGFIQKANLRSTPLVWLITHWLAWLTIAFFAFLSPVLTPSIAGHFRVVWITLALTTEVRIVTSAGKDRSRS